MDLDGGGSRSGILSFKIFACIYFLIADNDINYGPWIYFFYEHDDDDDFINSEWTASRVAKMIT